jgi:hypothetical protein
MWPLCFGFFENSKNNFLFPSTSLSDPRVVECILSLSKLKKKKKEMKVWNTNQQDEINETQKTK